MKFEFDRRNSLVRGSQGVYPGKNRVKYLIEGYYLVSLLKAQYVDAWGEYAKSYYHEFCLCLN